MFLYVLLILVALAFPACLINAVVLRIKDDERSIKYTIAACVSFAAIVAFLGLAALYM